MKFGKIKKGMKVFCTSLLLLVVSVSFVQAEGAPEKNTMNENDQKQIEQIYELNISPKEAFSENEIKEILSKEEFLQANLKSSIKVGEEEISDFISVTPDTTQEDLTKFIQDERTILLQNLQNSSNQSENEEVNARLKEQFVDNELLEVTREVNEIDAEFLEVNIIVKDEEKIDHFQNKLKDNSKIREMKVSEVVSDNDQKEEDIRETPEDTGLLQKVNQSIIQFLTPIQKVLASNLDWVPDYVSISFFDTDETDFYVYDEWDAVAENYGATGTTYEAPEVVWHWGRAYVAHTGTGGYTYTGAYGFDQYGYKYWDNYHFNNSSWLQGPYQGDKNPAMVSWNGKLWQAVRATGYNDNIMVRSAVTDSNNYGKPNFGSYTSVGVATQRDFGMTVHNGQLCVAFQPIDTYNIQWGCSWDGINFSWQTMSGLPGGGTNRGVEIESAHGDIYFGYSGRLDNKLYIYDSWNGWRHLMNASTQSLPSLSKQGDNSTQDEKLCLLHRGTDYDGQQWKSCLYRYGTNYDQWNWHPWQRQQGETNDTPAMAYDNGLLGQLHRGNDNKIYFRILRKPNPGSRGFMSHYKWNEDLSLNNNEGVEFAIFLDNSSTTNHQTYLSGNTNGNNAWPSDYYNTCEPALRYWSTNLPDAYVDTRFKSNGCDNEHAISGAISYSIGSGRGDLIDTDRYYFVYWNDNKGGNSKPEFYSQIKKTIRDCAASHRPTWQSWGYDIIKPDTNVWCMFGTGTLYIPIPYQGVRDVSDDVQNGVSYSFERSGRATWKYPYWFYEKFGN